MLTPLSKGQWQDLWNEVTLYVGNTQAELAGHPCGETQPEETVYFQERCSACLILLILIV